MASQVQRKLEFPVKKVTHSTKEDDTKSPRRTTRRSARNSKKNEENMVYRDKNVLLSPGKRSSDDEDPITRPPFCTPSPVKRKKEDNSPLRRDETPCRSSLAAKLAATLVSEDIKYTNIKPLPKSPLRLSPVKRSPLKGRSALKRLVDSPVKSPMKSLTKSKQRSKDENNPQKQHMPSSPDNKLGLETIESKLKDIIGKSPCKKTPVPNNVKSQAFGSPYNQAKQSFHTAKPKRLIGRGQETEEVLSFMMKHMSKNTGGSLYISGAPGTGKTAVLTHILDELKGTHSCKTVYLNCMTLDNPSSVYGKVYTDITGKNAPTAKERLRAVEKVISSEGPSIVLVLDEIDQLDSKNQEILYTIFEWPSLTKSRLILIDRLVYGVEQQPLTLEVYTALNLMMGGENFRTTHMTALVLVQGFQEAVTESIANALDLTDRTLPRLQARPKCRPQLLNFSPYTKDQISAILQDRIKEMEKDGTSVVDPIAIQFCARKISAVAGDMRKALDVCRRAVELVETDMKSQRVLKSRDSINNSPVKQLPATQKKIGVAQINNVLSEVYGSGATVQQQETIPLQQKLVVCTLLLMLTQGKTKEVTMGKLHEVYVKICKKRQMGPVDQSEFQGIVTLLESRGMLGMKRGKESRLSKVTLKLDEKELEHTMQDKVLISSILQDGLPN